MTIKSNYIYRFWYLVKYNKPLVATFTDDPITQQFAHLFHSSEEKQNCTMAETFLKQQERRIENVLGGGNCLFRAILLPFTKMKIFM